LPFKYRAQRVATFPRDFTMPGDALVSEVLNNAPGPAGRAFQLRDIPRPYFIRAGREQFRFLPRRVGRVRAAVAGGAAPAQQPVHRGLRAQVAALVQQDRVRLGHRLVGEPRGVQFRQDALFLLGRKLRRMVKLPPFPRHGLLRIAVPVQSYGSGSRGTLPCPGPLGTGLARFPGTRLERATGALRVMLCSCVPLP